MNINTGKCPSCSTVVFHPLVESIEMKQSTTTWRGISIVRPSCRTILSVSVDPIALKTDIVSSVRKSLKG